MPEPGNIKDKVNLMKGDITRINTDAIVNAANESLLGGGGVDGAIHRAAGTGLLEECRTLGGCPTGDAVITSGYNLSSRSVIHAVGPVWKGGHCNEHSLLASAYRKCLDIALKNGIETIAFPAISTGAYRFPKEEAALIAVREVKHFLKFNVLPHKVTFVTYDDENYKSYTKILADEGLL